MLTVSRSVDRVFLIIQLFTERRRPLSATEIRHALQMPHSSTISVLSRLVSLGYLDQNSETRRFYPSLRLHHLCDTLPKAVISGNRFAMLADSVHSKLNETTSISRLNDMFTMPIYARTATHSDALRSIPGLSGGLATLSVVGRTLLSMLHDVEIAKLMDRAGYWARRARVDASQDRDQIMRNVRFAREHGYLCGYNVLLAGVGAVSCPLPLVCEGEQLAITVAGSAARIERAGQHIISTMLREVASFCSHPIEHPLPAASVVQH
jgi:DNA-binding IclR family transcriptional regulator